MKDWKGNKTSCTQIIGGHKKEGEREDNDFYATPTIAIEKFLNNFNELDKSIRIFDPCAGKGHILNTFRKNGYNTFGQDLVERTDYFDSNIVYEGEHDFLKSTDLINDNIVTNPPYKFANEFLEHGMNLLKDKNYFCMLLKIQYLETAKRYELFKKFPPKFVYVFVNRIGCIPGGNDDANQPSAACYAWFVWQKGNTNEPIIRWLS